MKKIGIIVGVALVVIAGTSGGIYLKHQHDVQAEKARVARVYAASKSKATRAVAKAYASGKTEDVQKAEALVAQLHSKDRKKSQAKLETLKLDLQAIATAKAAVDTLTANLSDDNLTQAQSKIAALTSAYTAKDKATLQQLVNQQKEKLAAQKLAEEQKAKAEAEAQKAAAEKAAQEKAAQERAGQTSSPAIPAGSKLIALTFDDGPNPASTPQLLEILQNAGVPATFFALGQEAQAYPDLIRKEAALGNEVASHTWDHKDLTTLNPTAQQQEILSANHLINQLTGQNVTLFRPPYGAYNASVLAQTNLSAVNWSVDTNDWRYNTPAPVVQNALANAHDGAIILLHDIHSWSVAAVPQIIQTLKAQGYTFVTVSQLLEARYGGAQAHQIYFGQ